MNAKSISAVFAVWLALLSVVPAGEPKATPFFPFCIDTHDAKHRSLPQQAEMLRELGYDGVGHLWLDNVAERLKTLDEAGLKLYQITIVVDVTPGKQAYDPRLKDVLPLLKGRQVQFDLLINGGKPSDASVDPRGVKILREMSDLARDSGSQLLLYPHIGCWVERIEDAVRVAEKVNRPNVGVMFNLCHWLRVDKSRDYRPLLQQAMPRLWAVSINGADQFDPQPGWAHYLQPLDKGSFDVGALLKTLQELGYKGPIGLQCYGIGGDAREHLARSMATWRKLNEKLKASAGDSGKSMAPRSRRVLYNLDGDSCMFTKKNTKMPVPVTPVDLKTVVDEIAYPGSQVDSLLVCINAQCMYYPTKVGDRRGTLATPAERAKWPKSEEQRFRNVEAMFAAGVDPYALLLSEARRHGLEALLTYRMNDIHGDAFLAHKFWLQHPEYRLPKPYESWAVRRAGLDFGQEAVRDYNFRLIEEAVARYDCDGIELDFVRCPAFFQNGTEAERIAKMNDLVRRVRQRLDVEGKKRGRRLVLAVRVLPQYQECRASGLDPAIWAKERWIDFLTVSKYSGTQYDLPIKAWKELIKNVPIYGCADSAGSAANNRLAAKNFRKAGADGVYLFNFFCPREWDVEPPFEVLKDLGNFGTHEVH